MAYDFRLKGASLADCFITLMKFEGRGTSLLIAFILERDKREDVACRLLGLSSGLFYSLMGL